MRNFIYLTFRCWASCGGGQNNDENWRPSIHLSEELAIKRYFLFFQTNPFLFMPRNNRTNKKSHKLPFQQLPIKNQYVVVQHSGPMAPWAPELSIENQNWAWFCAEIIQKQISSPLSLKISSQYVIFSSKLEAYAPV